MLLSCSYTNNIEIIKYLIELGSNIKEFNLQKQKCIHLAATNNNFHILKFVYYLDPDLESKDCDESTPIDYSRYSKNGENFRFLNRKTNKK